MAYKGAVFPLDVHIGMFLPTLANQTTPEQREKWVALAKNFQILGTYAQTEMGHGMLYVWVQW